MNYVPMRHGFTAMLLQNRCESPKTKKHPRRVRNTSADVLVQGFHLKGDDFFVCKA